MKKKTWLKVLIPIVIVAAAILIAVFAVNRYLASRSVTITADDVASTVASLRTYLIVICVIIAAAVVVQIVSLIRAKKPLRGLVGWSAFVAAVLGVVLVINSVVLGPMYSLINNALGDRYYLQDSTEENSREVTKEIAEEGMVLLKNEDGALPLAKGTKLNVFGWASTNPVYGGTGSGSVDTSKAITLLQGLTDAGFELNDDISDFYVNFCAERPEIGMNGQDWTNPEPTIEDYENAGIFDSAEAFSDTALIVIARSGGENADLPTSITDEDTYEVTGGWAGSQGVRYTSYADDVDPEKSYLELTNREQAMVDRVTSTFDNVYVIINSANAMELGWVDDYDSIKGVIWAAGPGETGFEALGEILDGDINPSGRLVDTYVYDLHKIPAINWVGSFTYDNMHDVVNASSDGWLSASFNEYIEGIYVGYKFYETAADEGFLDYDSTVQYPFGYGLSYTSFTQSIENLTDDGTTISLDVKVTNTGDTAGKDVVEVYFTPPYTNGGIEKASVNLIQFAKTDELQPGESTTVSLSFAKEDMASYDDLGIKAGADGGYVLEQGDYEISIRSDSHTVLDSKTVTVDKDIIYTDDADGARESDKTTAKNLFTEAAGDDITYLSRANHFANYDEATKGPENFSLAKEYVDQFYAQTTYDLDAAIAADGDVEMPTTGADNGLTIRDMTGLSYDDPKWDELLDELTVDEMNSLIALGGYEVNRTPSIGLPSLIGVDGPAALKNNYTGQSGTAFPSATMIAATWNTELAKTRGEAIGQEAQDMDITEWYGPAMNIHRTPFSGRNFEYYSEDGVLSGYMGASEVAGANEYGVITYIKHFALNDSETNRKKMLATWSREQAMREIYLKPFEITVKESSPLGVMTAFNYVGTVWASASPELLQDLLRGEWGFQGSVVTDWFNGSTDGNMEADAAVRAGTSKMLSSQGDPMAYMTETDTASQVQAMRRAAHDYLYALANSNAMDDRNFTTPGWVKGVYTADAVVAVVLVLAELLLVRSYRKKKKAESR
ncbi:MAG: glycoside hydrolase family 3 protein [Lachnospiraceae bacterium]